MLSSRHCAMIKSFQWIRDEVNDSQVYEDTNVLENILWKMDFSVIEEYRMGILDKFLRGNPTIWWETHKDGFLDWDTTQLTLIIKFQPSLHDNTVK